MELEALSAVATENDHRAANASAETATPAPKAKKKRGASEKKKRILSNAFKADKLVDILLEFEAIKDVSDTDGLRDYLEHCDQVSRWPYGDLFSHLHAG